MIKIAATNITSPLGATTAANIQAVREGRSALVQREGLRGVPLTSSAAIFDKAQMDAMLLGGYTGFQSMLIASVKEALTHTDIDVTSPRTAFILATTKADVEELASTASQNNYDAPGAAARKVARYFGISSEPVVVCNACVSGVLAQVVADRLITGGEYDAAVVCGADIVSSFLLAGFTSFKALSPEPCRPFDIERLGLNIGEAAATMIFVREGSLESEDPSAWHVCRYATNNDAYHVSAPSPVADGTVRAGKAVLEGIDKDSLACVCVHGTATMFNDQSESKAVEALGLSDVPLVAFKGYYGHTMGAAGLVESILAMNAIDEGVVPGVHGFEEVGVSGRINISSEERATDKQAFLKLIAGFGGCNAAMLFARTDQAAAYAAAGGASVQPHEHITAHSVKITPSSLTLDGEDIPMQESGKALLTEIYKTRMGDNPKFYKMDTFSRLVIAAADMLMKADGAQTPLGEKAGVVIFNRSSSLVQDRAHIATYTDAADFFPSPSVFIYTLPNIVTGEIAIRYGLKGETSLYILDSKDETLMSRIIDATLGEGVLSTIITGWADCSDDDSFEAEMKLIKVK